MYVSTSAVQVVPASTGIVSNFKFRYSNIARYTVSQNIRYSTDSRTDDSVQVKKPTVKNAAKNVYRLTEEIG